LKDYIANELAGHLAEAKGAAGTVIRCAFGLLARRRVAKRRTLLLRMQEAVAELPSGTQLVGVHSELRALDEPIANRALGAAMSARWAQLKAKKDRREVDLFARFVEAQNGTWPAAVLAPVTAEIRALVAGFAVDDAKAAIVAAVAKRDEAEIKTALAAGEALGLAAVDIAAAKEMLTELAFLKRVEQAAASKELGTLEAVLAEASSLGLNAAAEVVNAQAAKAALLSQKEAAEEATKSKAAQEKAAQEKAAQEKAAQEAETVSTPPRKISLSQPRKPSVRLEEAAPPAASTATVAGSAGAAAPAPAASAADVAELERLRAENAKLQAETAQLKEAASKSKGSASAAPVVAAAVPATQADAAELRQARELAGSLEAKLSSLEGLNARCVRRGCAWDGPAWERARAVPGCKTKRRRRRRS
jgi:hypothetical protein